MAQPVAPLVLPVHLADALDLLDDCGEQECSAWCAAAGDRLRTGANERALATAAGRLGVPVESVRRASTALAWLLAEGARLQLSSADFESSLRPHAIRTALLAERLTAVYADVAKHLGAAADTLVPRAFPAYGELRWRLDVEVASRSVCRTAEPMAAVELTVTGGQGATPQSHRLCVDAATALHCQRELESALQAARSRNYNRVANAVKFAAPP